VQALWLLGTVAALTYSVVRMLTTLGVRAGGGLVSLVALLVGLLAWVEPMRLTAELGQINIVLLVLVVADLLGRNAKWSGVGIGLAAGIKLTPALFIIYLIATRRVRAAVVAVATFAGTVALGFAVAPRDSVTYWLRGRFDDVHRISHDPLANTSLAGLVSRLHGSPTLGTVAAGPGLDRGGDRRVRIPSRRTRVGVGDRGIGVGGCVAVQLESPLGVVRTARRPPRLPRLRGRQSDGRRGGLAAVRADRRLDRHHCGRQSASGDTVATPARHLGPTVAWRLRFRVRRRAARHGGVAGGPAAISRSGPP
jgi:hypothetical protein